MTLELLNHIFPDVKSDVLHGRYITNSHIEECFKNISQDYISIIGHSVEKRPIYALQFGHGPNRILMWSQMHGNESTTTKALFDCFNLFLTDSAISKTILNHCTIFAIPILNPDGAERYTRLNANAVDLNRDAQMRSQPESKVLRAVFDDYKPDFCFNLHGQRTIYNVGSTPVSSIVSFLSPSQDAERTLTSNRRAAMHIISKINDLLQETVPHAVARYDDGFNLDCVGDTFQNLGVPTLLYEAGHFPNDYDREEVRRLVFMAILKGLDTISGHMNTIDHNSYFDIPENGKQFYDIIIRNALISDDSEGMVDIAIQYVELLNNGKIDFVPTVESISKLDDCFGHKEIDAKGQIVKSGDNSEIKVTNENDFVLINNEKIVLKP